MKLPKNLLRSLTIWCVLFWSANSYALQINYTMDLEWRGFTDTSSVQERFNRDVSVGFETEFRTSFNDGNTTLTFTPFGRWDSRDPERRHYDIRELNLIHAAGDWEFQGGISKVFWGVAESNHLVDVINQTDYLENIDGEDKLGQKMIQVSRSFEQSTLSAFILPGFREREYRSSDDPLALPFKVIEEAQYESDDGNSHIDYAIRYSGYYASIDYGVSFFSGTSREPDFIPGDTPGEFVAYYPQMDQFSVDIQVTDDAWLWKLEAIRRKYSQRSFNAVVAGLEYSIYGMADGLFDLGLIAEYHYDDRGDPAAVTFQNDLFLGMRFGFNDAESSEILAGAFYDFDDQSSAIRIEANRRLTNNAKISIEAQLFTNVDIGNITYGLRHSDYILLSLQYFF
ncbi:MAG: hypothetical protein GKR95_24190 [Gammaproteobacteria bacterium]|nr:hypothetical protein [Gammaproteobacteria bacterium]